MRKFNVFVTLTAALLLALLVSSGVVAAPVGLAAAQASEQGDVAGVYVSKVYPAADASGLIEMLSLYPNNNAQLVSFYVGKDAPIVANGTWEAGDEQAVTVTLTGQPDRDYQAPAVVVYQQEGDTLVDGNFVLTRLAEVTPEEMDAGTVTIPEMTAPTSETPAGYYVSSVYPAADASGLVQLLALYANQNAQLISNYLGKDAPIAEVGTWAMDGETVVLTITGTAEESYDKPSSTTYMRHGDALVDGNFVLDTLPVVTPAEMDAMVAAPESPSGSYVSHVYPAADAAGLITVLSLFANNNAEQTSIYITKGAVTEVGTWEVDANDVLTLTITGTSEQEYDTPAVSVYQVDGETLVDGPFVLGKLQEISPSEMEEATAVAPVPVAIFESDTLPAASSPGRVISLVLYDDGTLQMSTDYLNDEPPFDEVGTWQENEDGTLTIDLTGTPEESYAEAHTITFEFQDDQIVAVDYDEALWGTEGLTLTEMAVDEGP